MEKYIYLCFFFLFSCANVVPLSGGEKDLSPPKVVNSTPLNRSINFSDTSISIQFDEYFSLNNTNNIRLSPSCAKRPTIKVVGKKIEIFFNSKLSPNTTYTINFGKEINDLNEGNTLGGFSFVFSTGGQIDSVEISGHSIDLFSGEEAIGATIGLYKKIEDLDSVPYYYSFTNNHGDFKIENMDTNDYVLFGFIDENNNLCHDDGEAHSTPTKLSNFNNIELGLYKFAEHQLQVKNPLKNTILFKNISTRDSIKVLTTKGSWMHEKKSSMFFIFDSTEYVSYSVNNQIDTIWLQNQNKPEIEARPSNDIEDIIQTNAVPVIFNTPIVELNLAKLEQHNKNVSFTLTSPLILVCKMKTKLDSIVSIKFPKGSLTNFNKTKNDSIVISVDTRMGSYGSLIIKNTENSIQNIELLKEGVVYKSGTLNDSLKINWLLPGEYRLRKYQDTNNNDKWDPGEISLNKFSEKIKVYNEPIRIRPNWEIELILENQPYIY